MTQTQIRGPVPSIGINRAIDDAPMAGAPMVEAPPEFANPRLLARLASGVTRRVAALARPLTRPEDPLEYERALARLEQAPCQPTGDVAAVGPTIAGWIDAGRSERARRLAEESLSLLRPDGLAADATGRPSLWCTAQTLVGWLACQQRDEETSETTPGITAAVERSAAAIAARLTRRGEIDWPQDAGSFDRWAPPAVQLGILVPFFQAARRLGSDDWIHRARRVASAADQRCDLTRIDAAPEIAVRGVEVLAQLSRMGWLPEQRAQTALACAAARVENRGRFGWWRRRSAWRGEAAASARALADLAAVAFMSGQETLGERMYARARSGWSPGAAPGTVWALFRALQARVAATFASAALPAVMDVNDGRAVAVGRWLETLPRGATLAEVGCGNGRMLRLIRAWRPDLKLVGVDPSRALLSQLPEEATALEGGLLRTPAANGAFDALLSVESLEHALLPGAAVGELVRCARPGGSILIIDKDRRRQRLSEHAPWERWFEPSEVARWLGEAGCRVATESVTHGDAGRGAGLFLVWRGTRAVATDTRERRSRGGASRIDPGHPPTTAAA